MTANERRGLSHPRRIRQKRTNTAANSDLSSHPQEDFTAVVSVFQAHLPGHSHKDSHAKPLDGKVRGEESDNTDPLASHRKIDSLDSYSVSCHRLRGY